MKYKVDILYNHPFRKELKLSDGKDITISTSNTARVTFINDDDCIEEKREYGVVTPDEFRRAVINREHLELRSCYLCNYEHRDDYGVSLFSDLDADDAFFDGVALRFMNFYDAKFNGAIFNGSVDFYGAKFNNAQFCKTIFNGPSIFIGTRFADVQFNNSIFHGSACFKSAICSNAQFNEAIFEDEANFVDATICNAKFNEAKFRAFACLAKTTFHGVSSFDKTIFTEDVDFSEALFDDDTSFCQSNFYHNSNFIFTTFARKTIMSKAMFYSKVDFSDAVFYNDVIFRDAVFDDVVFISTVFITKADFSNVLFKKALNYSYTVFSNVDFINIVFKENVEFYMSTFKENAKFLNVKFNGVVRFSGVTVNQMIDYENVEFTSFLTIHFIECNKLNVENCVIEKACDISCKMGFNEFSLFLCKVYGQFTLTFNDNLKRAILGAVNHSYLEKSQEFNFLKVNYNRNGEYDYEDQAYVEYRRCLRKTKIRYICAFEWFFLDLMSCYCTKPFRVLCWAFGAILAFAGVLYLSTILSFIPDTVTFGDNYQGLWGCLYHSVITFFTIGYGDSQPIGKLGLFLTGLEGFVGVFLMSLFTVSFVRKVLR